MEAHELELLRVPDLGDRISQAGLHWWHLPIVDGGVPDARFEHAWNRAGEDLRRRLVAGKGIVVHCRGGLGRTGIVTARLLVEFGEAPETALFRVRRARAGTVENRLQERYVCGLWEVQGIFETYSVQNTIGRSQPRAKPSAEHGRDGPCWPRLPEPM
jgi:ADP-ribosyl-[dinitrogen reductase] hydrolase